MERRKVTKRERERGYKPQENNPTGSPRRTPEENLEPRKNHRSPDKGEKRKT